MIIPRKDGLEAGVLKHSIEGDWQASEKGNGDEPFNLAGGADVEDYQEKKDYVAKGIVRATHSKV